MTALYFVNFESETTSKTTPDIWADDEMSEIQHILGITNVGYHCLFYMDNYPFKVMSQNYIDRSRILWIEYAKKNCIYNERLSG